MFVWFVIIKWKMSFSVHFLLFFSVFFWFSSTDWTILNIRAEKRSFFLLLSHTVTILGCALVKHLGKERWLSFDMCLTLIVLILEELVTDRMFNDLIQKVYESCNIPNLLQTVSSQVIMVVQSDCKTFCEWEWCSYEFWVYSFLGESYLTWKQPAGRPRNIMHM